MPSEKKRAELHELENQLTAAMSPSYAVFDKDLAALATFLRQQQFGSASNPYGMYNSQDRILNVIYRYWNEGKLGNRQNQQWGDARLDLARPGSGANGGTAAGARFRYERQTNVLSHHFW